MAFWKWPYTNLHDLNLDWILEQLKEFKEELKSFSLYFPHVSDHNNGEWDPNYNYGPNEIVYTDSALYIAKGFVPVGVAVTNTTYWLKIADFEMNVGDLSDRVETLENAVDVLDGARYYVYPEEYGAPHDGVGDDGPGIMAALNSGFPVRLKQTEHAYRVTSMINVTTDSAKLIGPCSAWAQNAGNTAVIQFSQNGVIEVNAEYFVCQDVYFYAYSRTAGVKSAIIINGPDNLNGDAEIYRCIFSGIEEAVRINARGLRIEGCLFVRGTPGIVLNYVGTTDGVTPITTSKITGGRGFVIKNNRFHTNVTDAIVCLAGASMYGSTIEGNISDHGGAGFRFHGTIYNVVISNNTFGVVTGVCMTFDGPINGLIISNNSFRGESNAYPNHFFYFDSANEMHDVTIAENIFDGTAYRCIYFNTAVRLYSCNITGNTFRRINQTGNNITYSIIHLPNQFTGVAVTNNLFGKAAVSVAGCCIRVTQQASAGSLNQLLVQGNIKVDDMDYLVHTYLQTNAVNSDLQTYRLNPSD